MNKINNQDVIKSFEQHYLKEDFAKALELLQKHQTNFAPEVWHYNLGTLYLKLNDPALGRFHLEKALQLGKSDAALYKNLQTAKTLVRAELYEKSGWDWDGVLYKVQALPTELCVTFVLVFALIFLWLNRKFQNWFSPKNFILIICLLFAAFPLFYKGAQDVAITKSDVSNREGPSEVFAETSLVPGGIKVILGKRDGEWLYIKMPRRYAGWVKAEQLGFL